MCGICGFITKNEIEISQLKKMNDCMIHRGPNDSGEEIFHVQGKSIGLAHRRLSIMDLSELGHQPMHALDGSVSLIFNGEIYNFQELRDELSDYKFKSSCDTEVIIAAYLKWGISCISHFNGMFAIALYDKRNDILYLARDRVGKKPLYYWKDGVDFVFASECKPIISYPFFKKEINTDVLNFYLCNEYIQAPDSIFKNMHKLEPGSILEYKDSTIRIYKFWDSLEVFTEKSKDLILDYDVALRQLDLLLNDSVKKRMIADVPVGIFLSGGIDSSLIAAITSKNATSKLKTFSIGFCESGYNEAVYAKKVADYLGTEHYEAYISSSEAVDLINDIPKYYDEPFADRSQVPTMLVSMLAKQQVDVALTGDGADEFFCGYAEKYSNVLYAQRLDLIGKVIHGVFRGMPKIVYDNLKEYIPKKALVLINNRNKNYRTQFHITSYSDIVNNLLCCCSGDNKFNAGRYLQDNWQIEAMLVDQVTYLPSVLCKVDRASMRYSLECRSPFLDYRILELSYRFPHSFKYGSKCKGKRILRDLLYSYVPRALVDRPKQGFGAPVELWLKKYLRNELIEYTEENFLKSQGIFKPEYVSSLIYSFLNNDKRTSVCTPLVWRLYIFQKWYLKYM